MNVLFVHWHTIMLLRHDFVEHPKLGLLPRPYRNRADVSTRRLTMDEIERAAEVIREIRGKSADVSFLEAYAKMQISPWNTNDGMLRAWGKRNLEFAQRVRSNSPLGLLRWKLSLAPFYARNKRWAAIRKELPLVGRSLLSSLYEGLGGPIRTCWRGWCLAGQERKRDFQVLKQRLVAPAKHLEGPVVSALDG